MTKELSWEESWGKVDWNTATTGDIEDLIGKGADIDLLWEATDYIPDKEMRRGLKDYVDFLYRKSEYLKRKSAYNEKKELEKTDWKNLTWEFVSGKVIKEMVKKGLDVNKYTTISYDERESGGYYQTVSSRTRYPLHLACAKDNIEAVKALIELGADPNKAGDDFQRGSSWTDDGKSTPVPIIDSVQSLEMANYLIEHGMKVTPKQMLQVKKRDKKRSGLLKLLDSLNEQPASAIRKVAKVAAVKEYRKQNPKSAGR